MGVCYVPARENKRHSLHLIQLLQTPGEHLGKSCDFLEQIERHYVESVPVFARDNLHVTSPDRLTVHESDDELVAVKDGRLDLSLRDTAKNTFDHELLERAKA